MEYRVLKISNNLEGYPECIADTKEFPHLVNRVEDEMALFIVADNGDWWEAGEFFQMTDITKFREI